MLFDLFSRAVLHRLLRPRTPHAPHPSRLAQPLHYRTYPGGLIQLTCPLDITNEFGWTVRVPTGFLTDGASIPRLFWPIVGHPFTGDFLLAAIVHDLLCHRAWLLGSYEHRVLADGYFFWLLRELGVPYWKRLAMYLAVRCYGRWCYRPRNIEHFLEVTSPPPTPDAPLLPERSGINPSPLRGAVFIPSPLRGAVFNPSPLRGEGARRADEGEL